MDIFMWLGIWALMGIVLGYFAGKLWKADRPYGLMGDLMLGMGFTILVGLIDWFVIPALGFSEQMKLLGIALEAPAGGFLALWISRKIKK